MNEVANLCSKLHSKNREYAVLFGAGFSKDAGVFSAWDILIDTLKPLYIQENKKKYTNHNIIENNELYTDINNWYNKNFQYKDMAYSKILGMSCKTEIERKEHLKKYFENEKPGEAHTILAKLIADGYIRYVFTTNFDDLLEKALAKLNVSFDVITSDNDIKSSISWEKVKTCRIYKLHGDYKKSKIKNTEKELEKLDTKIANDFQYITDRYGLIVIGYAGKDKGVMTHLLKKDTYAYSLYWQSLNQEPENTKENYYYYQLKNKYKETSNSFIPLIDYTASRLLNEIANGIDTLNRMISSSYNSLNYFINYVTTESDKRIRRLTNELIERFEKDYNYYFRFYWKCCEINKKELN